jgi:redox-sensing transcriptional repressor
VEKNKEISQTVINRIPRYYRYISDLKEKNVARISSKELAATMGITASQIRQDLNCFGGFGQQGYGYNVEKLLEELSRILGLHKNRTAVIIGIGNIGKALIKNFNFFGCGFRLICGFDASKDIIGRTFGDITIRPVSELEDYVKKEKPDIAVLTIPRDFANSMADTLVKSGIKGIWNFTNVDIKSEECGVAVENVHFSDSLMTLCYKVE